MATFYQTGQHVGTQYNAEAINIGAQSSVSDVALAIDTLKAELANLQQIPESVRKQVLSALEAADKRPPSPTNVDVKAKLDAAGNALSSVDGIAEKGLKLAQTLFKIGTWIVAAF